ncbi:MAG: orotidine-5'-phosphate decarboxylase [Thermincola sp.]|jgi:orotidine-5'-phosphate decarboxylase|nr:orotidine-5'-phosphate decarboxylase [Thermincola sp.]MDT3704019.1 orotidine-5'-phosphate decarboxylase [Thermincola sp.]
MLPAKDRLIVALDVDSIEEALGLVQRLQDHVGVFKVGMQLFNSEGPDVVRRIQDAGGKVFLDLKLHDIPNTVGQASAVLTRQRVFMFNVHSAGGSEMMTKAVQMTRQEAVGAGMPLPLVIGVTVLTSINQAILENEMGVARSVEEQVVCWAKLAKESGLNGVVASPQEIRAIRAACGSDFLIVTPGVRPAWAAVNDQKRVMTPREAVEAGASYLVVGRPITGAADPVEAAQRIVEEMEEGLSVN